jgi:hypothetical protein
MRPTVCVMYKADKVLTASMSIPAGMYEVINGTRFSFDEDFEFSCAEGKDTNRNGAFFTRGNQL